MTEGTLVYIFQEDRVVLAMKKRGFGVGKWNGAGGKLQEGESALQAAIRETQEEIGVTPTLTEPHGRIHFHDPGNKEWMIYVFRTNTFIGQPKETEEMQPQWFSVNEIPYEQCWADDIVWFPLLIAGQKFTAEVWLAEDGSLAKHTVEVKK